MTQDRRDLDAQAKSTLLRHLRELRETQALRRVAHERQAAAQCAQAMGEARAQEQSCLQRQAAHRQSLQQAAGPAGAPSTQGLSMAQLHHAFAWSAALQARTDEARAGVHRAQAAVDEQQARLQAQRQAWTAAQRGVDKARQLQQRLTREDGLFKERRLEDAWDEAAVLARVRGRTGEGA
jgi:hypothetical protein